MTENDAREWVQGRWDAKRVDKIERLVSLVIEENACQNLVAASTVGHIWARHIVDSAQLLALVASTGDWIDIGSGAGFPGLVVAILSDFRVRLIEQRRLRSDFLSRCVDALKLGDRVTVVPTDVRAVTGQADIISARAFAPLPKLLSHAAHLSHPDTIWLLPKGARASAEVADASKSWHGRFHVEQSIVSPESGIVVASNVRRR